MSKKMPLLTLLQRNLIPLTLWRNKWSGIGRTPSNIMHIVRVEVNPKIMGSIVFVSFVAKANTIACYITTKS